MQPTLAREVHGAALPDTCTVRLLTHDQHGNIIPQTFDSNPPAYAVLSHTWHLDNSQEVSFQDLVAGQAEGKPGYDKIRFCQEQAAADGLQYCWVDTCCIDTEDEAEHSQAIKSIFRWYQKATRCYVLLSDVSIGARSEKDLTAWATDFRKSRWFSRGWTLQELLAPSTVVFYSNDHHELGDRMSLKSLIYRATGIPYTALEGAPLSQFSVNERRRWKACRETKRGEDEAYSLQGLLDVDLAPNYGEGREGAYRRLDDEIQKSARCIQDLCDRDPRDDKRRLEEAKGGLLTGSYDWILHNKSFQEWRDDSRCRLLWIKGDPGKGKTMLLCGIIDELQRSTCSKAVVSFFFCQQTDARINNATAVLRGLLYMLVSRQPSLALHVRKKYDYAGKTVFEDANAWIALTEIFRKVLQDPSLDSTYLIVDPLDECTGDLTKLLEFVAEQSSASPNVKWIVSSRNWPEIQEQLERACCQIKLSLELNAESVSKAVQHYIRSKVAQLAQQKKYDEPTQRLVLEHLASNANDTFLWVALVCQELKKTWKWNVRRKLHSFPPGLDALYERMMQQIKTSDDVDVCVEILAVIALVYRPITLQELVTLVEELGGITNDSESLHELISLCGSFLAVREGTIYFVHQSAKDFLLYQAAGAVFPSGQDQIHYAMFTRSLTVLSQTLRRDMYSLKAPGSAIANIQTPDPDPLAMSRYSCVYWVDHLHNSISQVTLRSDANHLQEVVRMFMEKHYLYWLEALSLCNSMPQAVVAMSKLWSLVQGQEATLQFSKLVGDARRFVLYHKTAIEIAPLQAYASALVFSPRKSLVRRLFQHEEPGWMEIRPGMADDWSACLQTLEGHSGYVYSVAFSPDSTRLASASQDGTVKVWDASSGACVQTLEGHSGYVWSVAFSPDSTRLASASDDGTVKVWEASSGACLQTLEGHSGDVNSVAFSPNSTRLASASEDRTVKVWDASSGACLQTLEGHSGDVNSVAFSPNSTRLPSVSEDIGTAGQNLGLGISADRTWLTYGSKQLMWIPSEYRPAADCVSRNIVGIGTGNGKVWMCELDLRQHAAL